MQSNPPAPVVALGDLEDRVKARVQRVKSERIPERIWAREASVWAGSPGTPELLDRLGWLDAPQRMQGHVEEWARIATEMRGEFSRVLLCGMGGSSLAPEVLACAAGQGTGPEFVMLDSTSPAAVRACSVDLPETLFVVSSKSGTTLETMSFLQYFWGRAMTVGSGGDQFIAITDAGTPLDRMARDRGFRAVFNGDPDVGGRFSAISPFGLVPAALGGVDIAPVVQSAKQAMVDARDAENGAALWLGALLGEAWSAGRDKLVVHTGAVFRRLGLWIEQLIAESTGKQGRGILPIAVDRVPVLRDARPDSLFICITVAEESHVGEDELHVLVRQGHPVVHYECSTWADIGRVFYDWEFATAVAGSILKVNPFDQPNVAASKANTQHVLDGGTISEFSGMDPARFFAAIRSGDYLAILAYVPPNDRNQARLDTVARALSWELGVAVPIGFGPRYLHSTGQLHKGGPPTGHFLIVTELHGDDVEIPETSHSFGRVCDAQALGDAMALQRAGRPLLWVEGLDELGEVATSVADAASHRS